MDKCKRCGSDLPANAKFCTACGARTETGIPNASVQNVHNTEYNQGGHYQMYQGPNVAGPAPVYTAYQPSPKKKRWWIPVIIIVIVLAILAGVWFVFGNSIKSLFMSDNQKWQKAERTAGLIPEDSLLYEIRNASSDLLKKSKAGYDTEISFDIKADALPDDVAGLLTALSGIRLNVITKTDVNETDPHFHTRIALGKRGETADALSAEIYDAGDFLVIALPEILSKPLAIHKEFLDDSVEDFSGLSVMLDDTFSSVAGLQNSLETFLDKDLDKIVEEIKDIFIKYASEAELVKGEVLTVGSVSQKLDYYLTTVSAEKTPDMLKDILILLRDNQALKALVSELGTMGISIDDDLDPSEEYADAINDFIYELEENSEDFKIEIQRKLYVDKKNKAQGGEFILKNLDLDESISLASLHVIDGGKNAHSLKLSTPDGRTLEYLSEYTLANDLYTGSYSITGTEYGEVMIEGLGGSFSDFGLKKLDNELYPVGKLSFNFEDPAGYIDPISISYEGEIEAGRLNASLALDIDAGGSAMTLAVNFGLKVLTGSDLAFTNTLPSDYVDLSDEDALMDLMMDDSIMTNLMSALQELGIDLESMFDFEVFNDGF